MAYGTVTENGSTDWVALPEGTAMVSIQGTWGGATAVMEFLGGDGVTAMAIPEGEWTEDVVTHLDLGSGAEVRLTFSGNPTDLDWEIQPFREKSATNGLTYRV